jgi:hypothetical protein
VTHPLWPWLTSGFYFFLAAFFLVAFFFFTAFFFLVAFFFAGILWNPPSFPLGGYPAIEAPSAHKRVSLKATPGAGGTRRLPTPRLPRDGYFFLAAFFFFFTAFFFLVAFFLTAFFFLVAFFFAGIQSIPPFSPRSGQRNPLFNISGLNELRILAVG